MNTLRKLALSTSLPLMIYACATAVEIENELDPIGPDNSSPVDDAGVNNGAGGNGFGGNGFGGNGAGGNAVGGNGAGGDGAGGNAVGGNGAGGNGTGGNGSGAAGGTGGGGTAGDGGTGGSDMGGGTGGTTMTVDAGTGDGGAGGGETQQGVFDSAACNFGDDTGCEDVGCKACQSGDCTTRCAPIEICVTTNPLCTVSEADPLCAIRVGGTPVACTDESEQGNGDPREFMAEWVDCMCQSDRL